MAWALIETEVDGGKVNWVEVHPTQEVAINAALRDAVNDGVIKDTPDERERLAATLRDDGSYVIGPHRITLEQMVEGSDDPA